MSLTDLQEASAIPRQEIRTLLTYERIPTVKAGNSVLVMPGDLPRVRSILARMPGVNASFVAAG
jgi:hypothetical protein